MTLLDGLMLAVSVITLLLLVMPKNRRAGVFLLALGSVGFVSLLSPDARAAFQSLRLPGVQAAPMIAVVALGALVLFAVSMREGNRD